MARKKSAGEAQVTLGLNDSPLARGLRMAQGKLIAWGRGVERITGAIGGGIQNIGRGISSLGGKLLGMGSAALAAFAYPIKAASDLQETMSKFQVVFGDSADEIQAWGDTLGKEIGRGKTQIRQFLAANQDLLVPMGMAPGMAREFSKQITQLTFDLASFNNMADADVHRDLQAALTGSGEVMKKYGVIVSAAATKQELLNMGLDPKTATEAQKAQARLNIIMAGTTAAQGDAARTSGSFANQMKALKARLADSAATIGTALLPVVTPLIGKIAQAIEKVGAWVSKNPELVATLLKVAAGVAAAGAALTILGPIISGVGTAVIAAGVALGTLISGAGTLLGLAGALLTPLGAIVAGMTALAAVSLRATDTAGKLGDIFMGLGETFRASWAAIRAAISAGDLAGALEIAGATMKTVWAKVLVGLQSAWEANKNFMLSVWDQLVANIAKAILSVLDRVKIEFATFAVGLAKIIDTLVGAAVAAANAIPGVDIERGKGLTPGAIAKLNQTKSNARQNQANIDSSLESKAAARQAASDRKLAAAQQRLADAQAELQAALDKQASRPPVIPEAPPTATGGPSAGGADGPEAPGTAADISGDVAGTFSAAAVRGLARGNAAERTAKFTEVTAKNTQTIIEETRRRSPAFG